MAIQHIVCCTDFSENSESAFKMALEMAEKYEARLTILHVVPPIINPLFGNSERMVPEQARKSLINQLEEQMQQDYGNPIGNRVEHELVVQTGHVSTEIINYLKDKKADIVIMGAFGLSGMGLVIFGSVAKRVAHRAPCSVLVVR